MFHLPDVWIVAMLLPVHLILLGSVFSFGRYVARSELSGWLHFSALISLLLMLIALVAILMLFMSDQVTVPVLLAMVIAVGFALTIFSHWLGKDEVMV